MKKKTRRIRNNLVGQKFDRLTVLKEVGRDKWGAVLWKCICDCGNTTTVTSYSLTAGRKRSCGCYKKEFSRQARLPGNITAKKHLLGWYKQGAKKRNISFELTEKDFFKLTKENCFYCGQEPSRVIRPRNGPLDPNRFYTCNGIDRFDSGLGYTIDNCVTCCASCNKAKSDMSFEEFIAWIKRVHKHIVREGYK